MFRKLIPLLADEYHVVAPDYPGYGHSSMPSRDQFAYTFDKLAKVIDDFTDEVGLSKYALYVQDYGAPVGYRLAAKHPERVTAMVVQNGNAYDEGLDNPFWEPIKAYWREPTSREKRDALRNLLTYDATRWQYIHGVKNPELVSPDGPAQDQFLLDRPGNDEVQLDLFLNYGSNPPLYPAWQAYFRAHQPPMLIAWGAHDQIFPAAGAQPYKRDLKTLEYHLLDAGPRRSGSSPRPWSEASRGLCRRCSGTGSSAGCTRGRSGGAQSMAGGPEASCATRTTGPRFSCVMTASRSPT